MIGTVIGSYKLAEKIGEGGMGAVYRGLDVMLERDVAIKMLKPDLARDPEIVERFRSEAIALAKLNHPYIATLYSFLRQDDDYYMVMEYVRGETLDKLLRDFGAMRIERAIELFCQALDGIAHAHSLGIIHRDIKPGNMMVGSNGSIKVMDFGIARVLGSSRMTRSGRLVGTVEYMSPEQVRSEEADARSDIYSLGIVLYEMLTGRVPFSSTSEYELMRAQIEKAPQPPRNFAPYIPLLIEEAIMRAIAKKPEARYQSAEEFRDVLERSMRAATSPLENSTPLYAAPATRMSDSMIVPPTSVDLPGPIVVEGDTGSALEQSARVPQVNETFVLAPSTQNTSSKAKQDTAEDLSAPLQQTGAKPSFLSRLTWKHYAGAALVLLLLSALRLAFIGVDIRQAAPPPAVVEQTAPPQSPPVDAATQPSAPAGDQTAAQQPPVPDAAISDKDATDASQQTDSANRVRARNSRNGRTDAEQASAAKEEVKKEEKKGGVSGFLKKLNPFKRDKQPNKNRKP